MPGGVHPARALHGSVRQGGLTKRARSVRMHQASQVSSHARVGSFAMMEVLLAICMTLYCISKGSVFFERDQPNNQGHGDEHPHIPSMQHHYPALGLHRNSRERCRRTRQRLSQR